MATSNKNTLSVELKELIVQNVQQAFPAIVDTSVIHRVLKNENWDIGKAFHIFDKLQREFSKNTNNKCNNSSVAAVKKTNENAKSRKLEKKKAVSGASMNSPQVGVAGKKQRQKNGTQENLTVKNKFKKDIKRSYDLIKVMKEPFERIVNYGKSRIKVMVFMRGCPGSGKSTCAKEILLRIGIKEPSWLIFSADDFFIDQNTGKYIYNRELIQSAHLWNQRLVRQAASEGRSPLIIDNTHTKLWEMKDNAKIGVEYGYVIETLEPKTPWFFIETELQRKSAHNVSRETIRRMIDRYELNLSGFDVIHLSGLTYARPPPVRQIAEFNSPPSKKIIKLFENKSVIGNDDQFPGFDQQSSTEKNCPPKTNTNFNILTNPLQVNQTLLSGEKKMFQNSVTQPRFQKVIMKSQETTNSKEPSYQNEATASNIPNVQPCTFDNSLSSSYYLPSSSTDVNYWKEVDEVGVELSDYTNSDINFWQDDQTSNVATTFDLINLNENDQQPLIQTNLRPVSANSHLPSELDFTQYFTLRQEFSSSDETPSDSEEIDEEDDDEEELDGHLIESDSLEDVRNTINSICNAVSSEIDAKEKQVMNLCKEYILVLPDETILYQKERKDFPTNLNDFKNYCVKEEELQFENNSNTTDNISEKTSSSLSGNHLSNYEFVLIKSDNTLLYQKSHDNEPVTLEKFIQKSQSNINEIIDKNFEKNECKHTKLNCRNEDTRLNSNKTCNVDISLVGTSVLANKSINKEPSLTYKFDNTGCANNRFLEASSNTNYTDFEILKQINKSDDRSSDYRGDVLIGRPTFISSPYQFHQNYEHIQSTVLKLDKSSMTSDTRTNHIENAEFAVDSLVQMFPTIKRENLEELLNKCHKDLDWAVGLLLDSGHEMSEFIPSMEQTLENNTDSEHDFEVVNLEIDSNNSTATSKSVNSEKKKKKKNHAPLTDSSKDLIQNFQDKFKLNDNCYSESVMKVRRHRMLTIEDVEPSLENSAKYESTAMETGDDSPLTLEGEEEDLLEGEDEDEDERENDVGLVMDKHLVIQLQNKFGGLLSPNLISDKTILHIPKSLARQLYCYTFDAVYEQMEQQQAVIDLLINEGNSAIAQNDERLKDQPSFQEIMDHEIAVRMSQAKDNSRANTVASALSRTLLMERFPTFDPSTLTSILEETNHSLHAATNLLTLAGHPVTETSHEEEVVRKEESTPLSREEAIQQAHAYSDVAGKLYEMREDCLNKAELALADGKKTVAQYYSEMAKWYMERIEQSNSLAANAMLNGHEGATTLDLHFLQVQQALKVLDLFLDDKIRVNKRKTTVYIITGRGSHSPGGLCKIKQAVQTRLRKRQIPFSEQNPGMLRAYITRRAIVSYHKMVS